MRCSLALPVSATRRSSAMSSIVPNIVNTDDRSGQLSQHNAQPANMNEAQRIEADDQRDEELQRLQTDGYHAEEPGSRSGDIDGNMTSRSQSSSSATDVDTRDASASSNTVVKESAVGLPASGHEVASLSKGSTSAANPNTTDAAVHKLARQASRLSNASARTLSDDPFLDATRDPRLDPTSPKFSARAYTQAVLKIHAKDRNAVPIRRAGVAFRNLTASGIGADTEFQKTIFNAPLALIPMVKGLFGKQGSTVKILDDFAG